MARILIMDDSRVVRELLTAIFKRVGHSIEGAEDGEEGVRCARKMVYDAIFIDRNMPRLDGFDALKQLRQMPHHRTTPLMMLSAEKGRELQLQARRLGASGWVAKPFSEAMMLQALDFALNLNAPALMAA